MNRLFKREERDANRFSQQTTHTADMALFAAQTAAAAQRAEQDDANKFDSQQNFMRMCYGLANAAEKRDQTRFIQGADRATTGLTNTTRALNTFSLVSNSSASANAQAEQDNTPSLFSN